MGERIREVNIYEKGKLHGKKEMLRGLEKEIGQMYPKSENKHFCFGYSNALDDVMALIKEIRGEKVK